ncbi:PrsW family intramembrane metalloprotease [Pseudarthrobacter phenanthrenivorans]|uniref:PrsW family intramembrane metalloprotease n=1 Tax=Pseudarthrobacter phenanthrenivorans TaxID=361575 RepID=UPI00112AF6C1|nr:PrsW family intramembrane metalloprotease [Pseudarthrobacter phenanthrenivorans]TPV53237.1 PrsW family intramembrane metalloprotease [Pseudarthrobacter phenanthrenivorans]
MSMHPRHPASGPPEDPWGGETAPLPTEANPSWMGHIQPGNYRPAPGHQGRPVDAMVPPQVQGAMVKSGRTRSGLLGLTLGGSILAFLSLFLVVPFLLSNTGPAGFLVGFLASLIPLSVVLLAVYIIDKWEPEPKRLLYFAFTWGAAVSIAVTLLIQPFFVLTFQFSDEPDLQTYMATVQAPIVEEFAKSLGLLILLLLARKHFDGPVDGVVFAFTIAGGFAFTENILYFGRAIAESADPAGDFAQVFFLRGVMSPFAHAIFTGTTGLIMGFAARRWHAGASVAAFFVGLLPAMFLHNRWNSMGQGFLVDYILVQVPIFFLAVGGIILLRVAEKRLTRQRLLEYSAAGWFTPAEVELLATLGGRRTALSWAAGYGKKRQMKEFLKAATRLANTRQRILSGRDVQLHQAEERRELQRILALRAAVAG